jgi:metal-responsive CopG/Arc/MetJ family transcriptional regulator
MKRISITLPKSLLDEINAYVARANMTRSEFMRRAFEEELNRQQIAAMERQDCEAYEQQL